jgi:hypothetical protein
VYLCPGSQWKHCEKPEIGENHARCNAKFDPIYGGNRIFLHHTTEIPSHQF